MHLPSYHCVVCVPEEETILHLFFDFPFSQACWVFLGIQWNLNLPPLDMILSSRAIFGSSIFREVIILAAWCIWCHQNCIIFDDKTVSFAPWYGCFSTELKLVTLTAKPGMKKLNNLLFCNGWNFNVKNILWQCNFYSFSITFLY
ncbi:hypothetical protein HU200_011966 [Digitaria exilis]|uniref:Reverse transcriptase zinc-binding domain-containing protein n=1 Tax=Digitaria exilis TaxID=1010633 RepID=A0A835FFT9_9POAL|nr:hypothetical protein HU200_011966 [Digitaria exilis]